MVAYALEVILLADRLLLPRLQCLAEILVGHCIRPSICLRVLSVIYALGQLPDLEMAMGNINFADEEVVPCLQAVRQMVWAYIKKHWNTIKNCHPESVQDITIRYPTLATELLMSSTQMFNAGEEGNFV